MSEIYKKRETPQISLGRLALWGGNLKKERFVLRDITLRFIFSERFVLRIILKHLYFTKSFLSSYEIPY